MRRGITAFVLACCTGPVWGQVSGQVTLLLDDPTDPSVGNVQVFDEGTGSRLQEPPALQGIRLLDIQFNGRTPLTEKDPSRPRIREHASGASHIVLPHDRGALYRYERPTPSGTIHGFLFVNASGAPRAVASIRVPAHLTGSPFLNRIAVAPDGRSFLVATNRLGGGDVLEVALPSGRVENRTESLPALRVKPRGLALAQDWGLIATTEGLLRFRRVPRDVAVPVSFPAPTPTYWSGDIVLSDNGEHALTVAGTSPLQAHAYALDRWNPAIRVSQTPARMSQAGFLPQHLSGPYLAISDDGSHAAWRQEMVSPEGTPTTELFLAKVPNASPLPADHISSDARYLDTLDEVGQILFVGPDKLRYAVGEKENGPEGLGLTDADVFVASLPPAAGAPQIVNLSRTNGQVLPPFNLRPALKPREMVWSESLRRFLIHDDGDAESIVAFDPDLAVVDVLLVGVKELLMLEVTETGILAYVERNELGNDRFELLRHSGNALSPWTLLESTNFDAGHRSGVRRANGWVAYLENSIGSSRLARIHSGVGGHETLAGWTNVDASFGFTPQGSAVFHGRELASQSMRFGVWEANGTVRLLQTPAGATGRVLAVQ